MEVQNAPPSAMRNAGMHKPVGTGVLDRPRANTVRPYDVCKMPHRLGGKCAKTATHKPVGAPRGVREVAPYNVRIFNMRSHILRKMSYRPAGKCATALHHRFDVQRGCCLSFCCKGFRKGRGENLCKGFPHTQLTLFSSQNTRCRCRRRGHFRCGRLRRSQSGKEF